MTGKMAWRNGFTANAADLLQVARWAANWSDETFKQVLMVVAKRTRNERANVRTVENVLEMLFSEGLLTTDRS